MLCMAMTVAFALQFSVAAVDHFAHASDTPHAATELAGAVSHDAQTQAEAADDRNDARDRTGFVDHAHLDEGHSNVMPLARAVMCAPAASSCQSMLARGWILSEQAASPDRRPPRA